MKTVCLVLILVLLAAAGFADDRESGWQKAYPAAAADTAEAPVIETVQERSWRDSFWNNSTLTGDWFGQRTWLKDHGIPMIGSMEGKGNSTYHWTEPKWVCGQDCP
jgi:hypothetical protein